MFKDFCQHNINSIKLLSEIGEKRALSLIRRDNAFVIECSYAGLRPETKIFLQEIRQRVFHEQIGSLTLSRVFGLGPKVFKPTLQQLFLLREMKLNIQYSDYVQPFEDVVIELPSEYVKSNIIDNPFVDGITDADKHMPLFCTLHKTEGFICFTTIFSSGVGLSRFTAYISDRCIEDWLAPKEIPPNTTPAEVAISYELQRACMNYALLLDEVGIILNPDPVRDRLHKLLKKGNHESNRRQLRILPKYYSIKQNVVLHKSVGESKDLGPGDGTQVSPHMRRGHYRMQPYGTGNSLRKRIRVPPVFVNAHLFLGKMADTYYAAH